MYHRDTFDRVAKLYADMRPGYPAALFRTIAETTGLGPEDRVLEVGCGGGQATVDLARVAGEVLAIDPGAALVAEAGAKLSGHGNVTFAVSSFESLAIEPGAFGLVASAQAWHWVDPALAYERAAAALAPGGWLAIFGHVPLPPAEPVFSAFEAIFRRRAPELWTPGAEHWYQPSGPVSSLIARSALFGPAIHHAYAWSQTLDTSGYIALAGTKSYYNVLPGEQREALFADLAEAVDANGGMIELTYETHLYLAQKLD